MAEQATINLNVRTDESQKSLRAMRQELKQLQIAMDQASDPAEFKRLEAEFATLRNDMADTSQAMKYLDPGELLSGWTKMAQGAVGSLAAITGAMSLFGSESEEIQEIEKKSMVLIQTMMGLEQARQLLIDGGGRKQIAQIIETTGLQIKQAVATATQAIAQKGATLATEGTTVATRLLGKAMKSLPVMWLVAGLAAVAAGTAYLISLIDKETEAERRRKAIAAENVKINNSVIASTSETIVKLNAYVDIVKDANSTEKEKNDAMKAANSIMGTNATTLDELTAATGKYTNALIVKAQAEALAKRAAELYGELMDEEKLKSDNAASGIEKLGMGLNDWLSLRAWGTTAEKKEHAEFVDAYNEKYDLYENLIGQLKQIIGEVVKQNEADEAAAKAQKDKEKAASDAAAAWERYASAVKSANEEYAKFMRDAAFNAENDFGKIGFVYSEDVVKWRKMLSDKLISQEQYDAWYEKRTEQMNKDVADLQKKYDDDAKAQWQDTYDYKYELLTRSRDVYIKYLDDQLKAAGDDEDKQKEIFEKRRAYMYEYYDELVKLEEAKADADGIRSLNELAAIDAAIKKRDEYTESVAKSKEETEDSADALERLIALLNKIGDKASNVKDSFDVIAGSLNDAFANLTEMLTMEIDAQDAAWQESHDKRTRSLDDELEKAEEVWGRESEQYKYLLEQQKKAADEKAKHDESIEKKRKAAENKYKKASIAANMATATSDFAMASFEVWANALSKLLVGGIPMALALQAMLAASFGTQMGVMAKQMSLVGKMRLGGPVFGPSHESGGVSRELEGGEFVINAQSMKVPGVAQLANSLNRAGSAGSVPSVVDEASVRAIVNETVGAIAAIPVVVSERDITGTQRKVRVIESKTNF